MKIETSLLILFPIITAIISSYLTYYFTIKSKKSGAILKFKEEKYSNLLILLRSFVGITISGETKRKFFEGSHEDIVNILKENIGKEFVLIKSKGGKLGPKWWLKNPEDMLFKQVPLSDRVEKVVIDMLRGNIKVTFDEILQKLFITFPNGLTPDTKGVIEVLKEYATTTGDGRWRYKPEVNYRDSEHSEMVYYLSEIGKKAGYKVWIGSKEQGDTFRNEKETCPEIVFLIC